LKHPGLSQPLDLEIYRERRDIPASGNLIFDVCLERFQIGVPPIVRRRLLLVRALGQHPSQGMNGNDI